jgi:hypothetical protein
MIMEQKQAKIKKVKNPKPIRIKETDDVQIIDINSPQISNPIREALTQSIFSPPKEDKGVKGWMKRNMIKWLQKEEPTQKRFRTIHAIKLGFLHPLLKYIAHRFGRFMVKDINDIDNKWWNAHLRIMYHSFDKGLDDMWMKMYYEQGKGKFVKDYPTPQAFLDNFIKNETLGYNLSHRHRLLLIKVWMTEILEDSIDREWLNMAILNQTHEMMKFYGVSESEMKKVPLPGEFPIYLSITANNPGYFMANMHRKCWSPPDDKVKKEEVNNK